MKNIVGSITGLLCVLSLCACTTLATQSNQVTYVQACGSYGLAFQTALQLRLAGKLNQTQIDKITVIDNAITPICTGSLPTDNVTIINQIVTATASLTEASK